jgi:hypothetical protein
MRQYDNVQNLLFHLTDSIPQTVNLIGNTILSLHQNPQEFKKLKEGKAALKEKHEKDASELLMLGVSPHEVSDLGISPRELARIEDNQRRRKFLMTGNLYYIDS